MKKGIFALSIIGIIGLSSATLAYKVSRGHDLVGFRNVLLGGVVLCQDPTAIPNYILTTTNTIPGLTTTGFSTASLPFACPVTKMCPAE